MLITGNTKDNTGLSSHRAEWYKSLGPEEKE